MYFDKILIGEVVCLINQNCWICCRNIEEANGISIDKQEVWEQIIELPFLFCCFPSFSRHKFRYKKKQTSSFSLFGFLQMWV